VTDLADWVGANIVPVNHDVPYYPNQTLITKEGDCDDQANLLITLSRILGIPAYLQVGAIRKYGTDEGEAWDGHIKSSLINIGYHGWAMIYIPPWGWLPFDMTLGWRRENTLEGINSAPIWTLDGIKILDIVKSDWAGDGKTQKEEYLKSQLYIHYEDELIIQEGENLWANLPIMWPYGIFLVIGTSIVVIFLITRRKRRNLNISS
jgi:transglutaminase-like putative cysteine protease